jgi:hypothetical protein
MNDWTLMVYISADDILANFAVESLKQLKRAAGDGIEVVAQFDANVKGSVLRYAFGDFGRTGSSIQENRIEILPGPVDMTAPATLAQFIDDTTGTYPAEHYGLVLWGHGSELLFDDDVPPSTPPSSRRYFTPGNLRQALEYTKLVGQEPAKTNLDIIAIDACCMAEMEVASELHRCANYLIVSQDQVPDASFPYEQLLYKLKPFITIGNVEAIAKMVPTAYDEAFQDYISTPANGLFGITLSTLNLQKVGTITTKLKQLVFALLNAANDPVLRKKILDARSKSHDFEFGLFVDLFDFCEQLVLALDDESDLTGACKKMQAVIDGIDNECIIANQACGDNNVRCHGLSVYFPYQTDDITQNAVLLRKNSVTHGTKDRIARIKELEEDYSALTTCGQTKWMDFIKRGWSLIMAKEIPDQLDKHYSAQQCAQNLVPEECTPAAPAVKKPLPSGKDDSLKTLHSSAKHQKRNKATYQPNGDAMKVPPHQFGKRPSREHRTP